MQVVIEALHILGMTAPLHLASTAAYVMAIRVSSHQDNPPMLEGPVTRALIALWEDPQIKSCVQKSREYQLNDSAA